MINLDIINALKEPQHKYFPISLNIDIHIILNDKKIESEHLMIVENYYDLNYFI